MEKIFEILGNRLANFFTRSVAPSSIFFVLLFLNDKFFNFGEIYFQFICFIKKLQTIDNIFLYVILTILFLSYGYINQIFSQILDNFIKKNYSILSNRFFEKCLDKHFKRLKIQTAIKVSKDIKFRNIFNEIGFNDYNAYQVLGKDIKVSTSYVDEVKSIHTFIVALILNLVIYSFYFSLLIWYKFLFFSIILIVIFHYLAKSRYKARNKRLYVNYLLKEDKKEEKKETKILYKGRSR